MKKREIKLIAMDMDGTLLTSSKEITEHTIEVLEAAMDRGIQIVPATGRSVNGLPKKLTALKRMRYCILSNGARVYDLHKKNQSTRTSLRRIRYLSSWKMSDHIMLFGA